MSEAKKAVAEIRASIRDKKAATAAAIGLAEYWATYEPSGQCEHANQVTIMNDAIYALGLAIDRDKYGFAPGYARFKAVLLEYLKEDAAYLERAKK